MKEIVVVFDQDMKAGGFSWTTTTGNRGFPKTSGKPFWKDSRTCVLPVKLEKGQFYTLVLNSGKPYQNFRTKNGQPAKPLALYFTTLGASKSDIEALIPPRITKLTPLNNSKSVSPSLNEIKVTFNKKMGGGMSWVGGGKLFPETTGKAKWIDKYTCVMPVKLKPKWTYHMGFNSSNHVFFQSEKGVPLKPVRFSFSTSNGKLILSSEHNDFSWVEKSEISKINLCSPFLEITKKWGKF